MQLKNWTIARRVDRGQLTYFLYLVVLAVFAPNSALAANTPSQISIEGTVGQVFHDQQNGYGLQIDSAQGALTAALGPKLNPELKQSLVQSRKIRISGTMQTIGGQQTLIVHSVSLDGKQTTIRNDYGFLLNASPRSRTEANQTTSYRSSK